MGGHCSFCCYKNRREGGLRRFGSMPTTRRTITTVPNNTTATLSLSLKTASFCCTHSETKNERKRLAFFFLSLSFLARIYLNREKRKGHHVHSILHTSVYTWLFIVTHVSVPPSWDLINKLGSWEGRQKKISKRRRRTFSLEWNSV